MMFGRSSESAGLKIHTVIWYIYIYIDVYLVAEWLKRMPQTQWTAVRIPP